MNCRMPHFNFKKCLNYLALFFAIAVSAQVAFAQARPPVTIGPPQPVISGDPTEDVKRHAGAVEMEERKGQISEDFQQLQALHDQLRKEAHAELLEYSRIARTADEVKSRATRLSTNLALPPGKSKKAKEQVDPDPVRLKNALMVLDGLVASFLTNPTFQKDKAYNPQEGARAREDLGKVIELSGKVIKAAEKLNKASNSANAK